MTSELGIEEEESIYQLDRGMGSPSGGNYVGRVWCEQKKFAAATAQGPGMS